MSGWLGLALTMAGFFSYTLHNAKRRRVLAVSRRAPTGSSSSGNGNDGEEVVSFDPPV